MHNNGSSIYDYQKAVSCFLSNCHKANIVYKDHQGGSYMSGRSILSEKPEDNKAAAEWGLNRRN